MDQRLKLINETYKKLGENDIFRFHCTQCGKCCINREDILLNPHDLFGIAKLLKTTPLEIVKKYCESYIGDTSRMPIVRLKPQGNIKRCPLLKDQKCSVHQAKPVVCAMFPIGRMIAADKSQWDSEKIPELKVEYIFSDPGCGDKSEVHTVKEWLSEFNIPVQDETFITWQQSVVCLSSLLRKMESAYSEEVMNLIWNMVFSALYLNYDTEGDYSQQFKTNFEKLKNTLKQLENMEDEK